MKKLKIAVLFGGCSPEHDVSLQSAYSVLLHMDPQKYDPVLLGITRDGRWYHYQGPLEHIGDGSWEREGPCVSAVLSPDRAVHGMLEFLGGPPHVVRLDAAFPVLHGKNGEDGTVQGLLELAGIPCVGCGTLSSALCMDKDMAHRVAQQAGVPVPRAQVLTESPEPGELSRIVEKLGLPLFVKPCRAGSSFGISRVEQAKDLPAALEAAFREDSKVLLEEAVPGREVGCAVLGGRELTLGAVDEVELSGGFFDYQEKYTLKTSKIHMPARISAQTAQRVQRTAARLYRALDCSGCARVDLFLTPGGELIFNEVNTLPGFTSHSRYPSMLQGAGLSFVQVVDSLISQAVRP